ncbi:MAG TPA: GH32 C-terminal domain-containing protein [Paenibacillus sp.]|uniref:GH32 C-terminal domain-containing protein n=1 Tax=Paenibacillus sp. TaxID=58172 RepID=UPI002CDB8B06|nr:GH32 C-terminal domain-containing protein [Paenibacillus sp.]HUC90745.1 GH32 C-terminal domain-containing protein [Paenibacillus sp.]
MKRNRMISLKAGLIFTLLWSSVVFFGANFVFAADWNTNMPGYLPVSGTWTTVAGDGLKGVSAGGANAFNMSTATVGTNFVYEADVKVDASTPFGVGALVFRAGEDGSNGYVVHIDPNLDRVRLFDFATGSDVGPTYSTTINTGAFYRLKVVADGSVIKIYLGSTLAISVSDTKYAKGNIGFNVYNGTAYFQNVYVYETKTNVIGWNPASGTWTTTSQGWKATAAGGQNAYAVSGTSADNFTYEADMIVQNPYAVGMLLFRSSAGGSQAYALQVDPNLDRLRLFKTDGDVTLATYSETIDTGKVYHVKIKAEGSTIKVYLQTSFVPANGYDPVITVTDSSYASGFAGLGVYNGSVSFQNIMISDMLTNLNGWTTSGGEWTPHLNGVKAVSSGAADTFRIAATTATDFVLEGDLKVDAGSPLGTAALVFRADSTGSAGYVLNIDPNLDRVWLFNANGGATIAAANMTIDAGKTYHIEVIANGSGIKVYVDGYATPAITVTDASYSSGRLGLNAYNGTAYFQNVYVFPLSEYYTGLNRPQYHYTMAQQWISDPNGLVYYEGEYHLFAQDGGNWTHAVSTDLVNWKRLPIALPWTDSGHAWSGSSVVDANNVSGLFSGGSGLIAYYTMFHPDKPGGNQKIGVAYSRDKGRTWEFYGGNPIIQNPGGANGNWDFRDPKVVWDGDRSQWVMVVSGGDHVRFFTSADLLNWTYTSSFGYGSYLHGGTWETPDFFQLTVDGNPSNKKWVLVISTGPSAQTDGSSSEYFVGTFDGTTFTSDNPASTVLRGEYGKDMYAAMTFSDIPAADGRRIQLGWMSNWDYPFSFPTWPWKHQMSIPRVLKLKNFAGEGVRLVQTPIAELNALRGGASSWSNVTVTPDSSNLLEGLSGNAYEIEAEVELPASGAASEFGFRLRELGDQKTVVGYNTANSKMFVNRGDAGRDDFTAYFTAQHEAVLSPVNNRVKMRIYVDESSVEVFGNDGKAVFSNIILPDLARDGMSFYATGGNVTVVSLKVYPLANTWRYEPTGGATPERVVMDRGKIELGAGSTQRLYMTVLPRTAANKNVTWSSSNASVSTVSTVDSRSANVTGVAQGRAVITATTQDGSIVGTTVVNVGASLNTNMTGWTSYPAALWATTGDGIAGTFDRDSAYMSTATGTNFTYEADIKLDETGGSGSLIFRSDSDGSDGYYLQADPVQRSVRLFYKVNGSFSSSQVLATSPMLVQAGKTYRVKVVTSGTNIKVYFDGGASPVIDVNDTRFGSGYFGVSVSGGRAYFQNVLRS